MAVNIASNTGSTTMGCFIICENVSATVYLQETSVGSNQFQLLTNYSASGHINNAGSVIFPISGNGSGSDSPFPDVVIQYEVNGWTLTATTLSFYLTVSIGYNGAVSLGPDYLFQNVLFSGPLPTEQVQTNAIRAQRYVELDAAIHKLTGVSCTL